MVGSLTAGDHDEGHMDVHPVSSSHPLQCGHLQPSRLLPSPIPVVGKVEYRKTMWISQQLCMQLLRITLLLCP
jgi:hypothetical protein